MAIFNTERDKQISKAVISDFSNNKKIRENYKSNQQTALDLFCPRRGSLDDMVTQGDARGTKLWNSVGIQALNDWVAGYMGNHITAAEPWFNIDPALIGIDQVSDEISDYFQRATAAMFTLLSNTNFYIELPRFLKDGGSWGTAVGDVEFENGEIVYRTMHPRESYLIPDKRGYPSSYMREFQLEAINAVEEYGLDKMPQTFQTIWNQETQDPYLKSDFITGFYQKDHPVAQLAVPRPNRNYILLTVMKSEETLVDMSFRDRLLPIWRPSFESDEIYGRSPAMSAARDAEMGNDFSQADIGAAQLSVQPMMNVHKKNQGLNEFRPWGEHIFDSINEKTTPVTSGINYPIGVDREERLERAVQDHFKISLFKFLTSFSEREMTAREVIERKGEQVRMISTELNSLNPVLNDLIEITFDLGLKNGMIPQDVPQELVDLTKGELNVSKIIDYTGPLAMIQKALFRTQSTDFALERLAVKAEFDPTVIDVVDWTKSAREDLKSDGFSVKHLLDPAAVKDLRAARAEKEQLVENMAVAESQAQILKDTKHLQTA